MFVFSQYELLLDIFYKYSMFKFGKVAQTNQHKIFHMCTQFNKRGKEIF